MKKYIFSIALLFISFHFADAQADTVINRYRDFLIKTTRIQSENIDRWTQTISSNGQWPDINYKDQERANWQLWDHLKRLDKLSIVWRNPASSFYHDKKVWKAINLSLNNWLKNKYQNPNWWHNEIGVPQSMRDIIILLKDTLSSLQLKQALEIMAQLHVQKAGAGANLIWSADLGFHYGALTHNLSLMDSCRRLILNEIHIGTGEGIQPDYSFHQHGNRLQVYQYGKAFLLANIRLAWELRDTRWAFTKDKIQILTDFLLKGWQWMARGINTVPGTMDRSASRTGELHSPDIRYMVPFLYELSPEKINAFKIFLAHQNDKGGLSGYRYYPYSDFAAYQNKDFSFFLKTISTRTLPTEVGLNSENLKGKLLNSGDAYLIQNGKEYYNMMPVWNWQKLPGVTAFREAYKIERKPFAGSVSDGENGLTAMDYVMESKSGDQDLSAHKIWACHKNTIVCLIAGLTTKNIEDKAYTALDQCRMQGEVIVNDPGNVLKDGNQKLSNVKWIWHHGFAYIPIKPSMMEIKAGKITGSWSSINASSPSAVVTDSVFMPVMLHDIHQQGASTGYVLASCKSPRQAGRLASRPRWKLLNNDKKCQALKFEDGTIMAAFFSASYINIGKQKLQVDKPCLLLMTGKKLYASDPSRQGNKMNITWGKKHILVILPPDGTTVESL